MDICGVPRGECTSYLRPNFHLPFKKNLTLVSNFKISGEKNYTQANFLKPVLPYIGLGSGRIARSSVR